MKKVTGYISVRALGTYNYEFYVDDDATDEEIEKKIAEHERLSRWHEVEDGYEEYMEVRYRKGGSLC